MAVRRMLFACFRVVIAGGHLQASVRCEPLVIARHHPAVEVKGATLTALRVTQLDSGLWLAQTVVDV